MKIRAFVFDDSADIRLFMKRLLERRGYEVLDFPEPAACPVYQNQDCPCPRTHACADILITDLNMPNASGLQFIDHQTRNGCKGMLHNKAVMSGAWTIAEMEQALRFGCKIFDKPVPIPKLEAWLDGCEKRISPGRKLASLEEIMGSLP